MVITTACNLLQVMYRSYIYNTWWFIVLWCHDSQTAIVLGGTTVMSFFPRLGRLHCVERLFLQCLGGQLFIYRTDDGKDDKPAKKPLKTVTVFFHGKPALSPKKKWSVSPSFAQNSWDSDFGSLKPSMESAIREKGSNSCEQFDANQLVMYAIKDCGSRSFFFHLS